MHVSCFAVIDALHLVLQRKCSHWTGSNLDQKSTHDVRIAGISIQAWSEGLRDQLHSDSSSADLATKRDQELRLHVSI
jgi:hypothetical protein